MSKFIVFSGLDGSGKSTQIELLKNSFAERGQKNIVFWSRGGYTRGFQKLKDILRIFSGKKLPKSGNTPRRDKALSNSFIRKVWLTLAMLDLFYYYVIYLRFKNFMGYNIICDRYLMDTAIDFNIVYPQEKIEKWLLWRVLKKTLLKPDFHFVLTISVEESRNRSLIKKELFPDSIETLILRLEKYNEYINNNPKSNAIWCQKSIVDVTTEINNKLSSQSS